MSAARACALAGWEYRLLGEADVLVTANLRWFAGWSNRWKEALNAFEMTLVDASPKVTVRQRFTHYLDSP